MRTSRSKVARYTTGERSRVILGREVGPFGAAGTVVGGDKVGGASLPPRRRFASAARRRAAADGGLAAARKKALGSDDASWSSGSGKTIRPGAALWAGVVVG